jgi:hypothetical protein
MYVAVDARETAGREWGVVVVCAKIILGTE